MINQNDQNSAHKFAQHNHYFSYLRMAAAQGGDFYQDIFPYINDRDQPMQAIDYLQGKGELSLYL